MMTTNEKYTLPTKIETELAELPEPMAPDYLNRLQHASMEVVVIARRLAADRRLRDQIDSILVDRTYGLIHAAVYKHSHVPREEFDEAYDEATVLFWEAIQDESFFEIRFNLAMMRIAQQAGRKIHWSEQRQHEWSAMRIDTAGSEDSDDRDTVIDIANSFDFDSLVDDRRLVEIGLAALTDEQARALILHYYMGYPIFSSDPTVETVATLLGCRERKARRLIADGKAAFQHTIGQENNDE